MPFCASEVFIVGRVWWGTQGSLSCFSWPLGLSWKRCLKMVPAMLCRNGIARVCIYAPAPRPTGLRFSAIVINSEKYLRINTKSPCQKWSMLDVWKRLCFASCSWNSGDAFLWLWYFGIYSWGGHFLLLGGNVCILFSHCQWFSNAFLYISLQAILIHCSHWPVLRSTAVCWKSPCIGCVAQQQSIQLALPSVLCFFSRVIGSWRLEKTSKATRANPNHPHCAHCLRPQVPPKAKL